MAEGSGKGTYYHELAHGMDAHGAKYFGGKNAIREAYWLDIKHIGDGLKNGDPEMKRAHERFAYYRASAAEGFAEAVAHVLAPDMYAPAYRKAFPNLIALAERGTTRIRGKRWKKPTPPTVPTPT